MAQHLPSPPTAPPGPLFTSYCKATQNLIYDVRRGDYVLHPSDVPALQGLLAASKPRLEQVAQELSQLRAQQKALEHEHVELTTILTASRSALSHIRKLPLSVLLEIFEYLLPRFPDEETDNGGLTHALPTSLNKRYGPWLVMRVCRKWRFVCQTTPWLWTDVYLRLSCESASGNSGGGCFARMSGRLKQYLDLSKRASPTSIASPPTMRLRIDAGGLDSHDRQCKSVNMVLDLLARENERWSSIDIRSIVGLSTGSKTMFNILEQLMGTIARPPFKSLQTLKCSMDTQCRKARRVAGSDSVVRYYGPMQDFEFPQLMSARFLDTVTFQQLVPSVRSNMFPWAKIQYLTLTQVSARVVLDVLPHIADTVCLLNLLHIRPPVGEESAGSGLLQEKKKEHICKLDLEALAIPNHTSPLAIVLKNLRTLHFNPPCSAILDRIDCPQLATFAITHSSEQPKPAAIKLLSDAVPSTAKFLIHNSSALHMVTVAVKLKEKQYELLLENMPNVHLLQVLWPTDYNTLIKVLSKTLGKTTPKPVFLPKLSSLIVFGYNYPEPKPSTDARKVWEMMSTRGGQLKHCRFMSIPPDDSGWDGAESERQEAEKAMYRLGLSVGFLESFSDEEDSDVESDTSEDKVEHQAC